MAKCKALALTGLAVKGLTPCQHSRSFRTWFTCPSDDCFGEIAASDAVKCRQPNVVLCPFVKTGELKCDGILVINHYWLAGINDIMLLITQQVTSSVAIPLIWCQRLTATNNHYISCATSAAADRTNATGMLHSGFYVLQLCISVHRWYVNFLYFHLYSLTNRIKI